MKKRVGVLSCVVLACTVTMAEPATTVLKEGFQIGPNLGYTFGGDVNQATISYGVQGVYQFKEVPIKIELAYDRLKDSGSGGDVSVSLDVNAVTLTGWWCIPLQNNFSLYAGGGLGYYMPSASVDLGSDLQGMGINASVSVDNAVGFILGGGVEYAVSDNIGLFADLRYTFVNFNMTATASAYGESESAGGSGSWDHFMLRVGGNYKF